MIAGDLLNQCIGSSFGLKENNIPFIGLYGACSTMALSIILASLSVSSGFSKIAEKQMPLTLQLSCDEKNTVTNNEFKI